MKRPEEAVHRAIVAHLRFRLPKPWLFWHTPNGGARSKAEGGVLKALGTLAGIPDLFVAGDGRVIAIEIKGPKGVLSPSQIATLGALATAGIPTIVARSWDDVEAALRGLGVPLTGRTI